MPDDRSPTPAVPTPALNGTPQTAGTSEPSRLDRWLVRMRLKPGNTIRENLADALSDTTPSTHDFTAQEQAMLANILRLREVRVEDVMVPRGDVVGVDRSCTLGELLHLFEEHGHSRLPVFRDSLDDPMGMVHIKDLMLHLTKLARATARRGRKRGTDDPDSLDMGRISLDGSLDKAKIMRRVLFVPPSMLAVDLMGRMQATRTQMALVIDEYGGTDGLVSLEDIVEEVVGEIEDEHDDDEEAMIVARGEGVWSADARAELSQLRDALGEIDLSAWGDEVDTLGGLVFTLAGHIPVRGEVVTGVPGYEFRITDADPRRVRRLQIVARGRGGGRRRRAEPPMQTGSVAAAAVTAPSPEAAANGGATDDRTRAEGSEPSGGGHDAGLARDARSTGGHGANLAADGKSLDHAGGLATSKPPLPPKDRATGG